MASFFIGKVPTAISSPFFWPPTKVYLAAVYFDHFIELFLFHPDVVPVHPNTVNEWKFPPYSGYFDGNTFIKRVVTQLC